MDIKGLKLGIGHGVINRQRNLQLHAPRGMSVMPRGGMLMKKITCSSIKTGVNMDQRADVVATGRLSDMWQDYQGSNHWDGLLDPMDDNLRGEILRYGDFVDAAYMSFDFDTSSPGYATCRFPKNTMLSDCGLGGRGYTTTRYLRATSGVRLPRWVDDRAPSWISARSSWMGYVAVCNDKEEISRLGRRDVVIAYRGTATCLEWVENVRATLTCLDGESGQNPTENNPMVESGFLSLYTSRTSPSDQSLRDSVKEEMARIMQTYGDEPLSVTVVGHSLGAALATLTAYDITATANACHRPPPLVTVFSFGGPRVGNRSFRSELSKRGAKVLRIVNSDDFITKVPGFVIDNNDVSEINDLSDSGLPGWLQKRVDTRWVYADVGKELRLSSKESPYLSNPDVATCHDLKTYLHLVDGFVSSTCPFRATAKRLLTKS
ncbi:phospholipase A(1) DAD1, chloroplastic-like [Impatiens glandulifera]|uniref:phospholipase A(1) DAD1, chloroplastic-like n=1 Tax=Impatiens glandulifera TaxID=253017 RepID=UPI001FB10835|nr:phospholipase A(1) DAD1, chloroplastic-like [Impatiens glandulifera]